MSAPASDGAPTPFAGIPGAVVCLSSAEWDAPLWTNRQHVMSTLARRQPVVFVHTAYFLPRRALQLLRSGDAARGLRELFGGVRPREDGVLLFSAWNLVPFGRRLRLAGRLNARVTAARLNRALRRGGMAPAVAWAYDPLVAPIVRRLAAPLAVYHCVDDHAAQVAGPVRRRTMRRGERELLAAVDIVFTTARPLAERLSAWHHRVHLQGNVADYDHFARAAAPGAPEAPELTRLPRPRLVFIGALSELKVDLGLLEALSDALPSASLLLVGPVTEAGRAFRRRLDALAGRPGVRMVGERPYAELPRYLAGADVALVPYRANHYTEAVFPMKIYEYLAASLPVVAAGIPEAARAGAGVTYAADPASFVAAVRSALDDPGDAGARQANARGHTWVARTLEMDRLAREVRRAP